MLPYKRKQTVVVNPEILNQNFHFGPIPTKCKILIGTIVEVDYVRCLKTNTYLVSFPDMKKPMWFKESEILP